jgi:hypothetical protein
LLYAFQIFFWKCPRCRGDVTSTVWEEGEVARVGKLTEPTGYLPWREILKSIWNMICLAGLVKISEEC